jgi:hypothetical protein
MFGIREVEGTDSGNADQHEDSGEQGINDQRSLPIYQWEQLQVHHQP